MLVMQIFPDEFFDSLTVFAIACQLDRFFDEVERDLQFD